MLRNSVRRIWRYTRSASVAARDQQISRIRVKRAIVADSLVTGVLLVFTITEDDDISWSHMLEELILFVEESVSS